MYIQRLPDTQSGIKGTYVVPLIVDTLCDRRPSDGVWHACNPMVRQKKEKRQYFSSPRLESKTKVGNKRLCMRAVSVCKDRFMTFCNFRSTFTSLHSLLLTPTA